MRLKGRFQKHHIQVGLSEEVPMLYSGPEQKYVLSELLSRHAAHIKYEKSELEFDLLITSDELVRTPERVRCYSLISSMPEAALPEVEETLRETREHYLALAAAIENRTKALPAPPKTVQATVLERVRS